MPFPIYTLPQTRQIARDYIGAKLPGSQLAPPNSRLRVLSDSNAGLAHLNLLYLYWLSQQLLPDTAEAEWLDRHGNIWLGGRKAATQAFGTATFTGTADVVVPSGTQLAISSFLYETTADAIIGSGATAILIRALLGGAVGNAAPGAALSVTTAIAGLDAFATVVLLEGGTDTESDDELRARVIFRIQKPPMGGDADDYVAWSLAFPGVTRAWAAPQEQGIGTMTVRVMMDDLRASNNGLPTSDDLSALTDYLNVLRPVTVKDFFVEAPIFEPINFTISNLDSDNTATRAAIAASVAAMLKDKAAPAFAHNGVPQAAQTIYAAWVSDAIMQAIGVNSFDLTMSDHVMPNPGNMASLGTITYA